LGLVMGSKSYSIKNWAQTQQKFDLKIRLSIRIRNFSPRNKPLAIKKNKLYFSPKVPYLERLHGIKITKNVAPLRILTISVFVLVLLFCLSKILQE
jgi:hypothetical protein